MRWCCLPLLVLLLLQLLLSSSTVYAQQLISIDAVTLLLPPAIQTDPSNYSVTYPLHAHGGCFTWHNPSPDVLSLSPIAATQCTVDGEIGYTGVTLSAHIPHTVLSSRRSVFVWASLLTTALDADHHDIHCEVFIDHVSRLEMLTNTRRVSVGDIDSIALLAYDREDNVFSSVEGLPFHWHTEHTRILPPIPLSASGLNVSDTLLQLEQQGITSHLIAVIGAATGKTQLTAQLILSDKTTASPIEAQAEMIVIEPLLLHPTRIRVPPAAAFIIQVQTKARDIPHSSMKAPPPAVRRDIPMPSTQYKWTQSNASVLSLDRDLGSIVALEFGHSEVVLQDLNVPDHHQQAEVRVVQPHSIALQLMRAESTDTDSNARYHRMPTHGLCNGSWFIRVGSQHQLLVSIKDIEGELIHMTPNMQLEVELIGDSITNSADGSASSRFTISSLTPTAPSIRSVIGLYGKEVGISTVEVLLSSVKHIPSGLTFTVDPPLRSAIEITVTPPVSTTPSITHLPSSSSAASYQLLGHGGSGVYTWKSVTEEIVQVTSSLTHSAIAIVTAIKEGLGSVHAFDLCNPDNSGSAQVEVVSPAALRLHGGVQEAQLGESLQLIVLLTDKHDHKYDNCSVFSLQVSVTGTAFVLEGTHNDSTALVQCQSQCNVDLTANCYSVWLRAQAVGTATVQVKLVGLSNAAVPQMNIPVVVFQPMQIQHDRYMTAINSPILMRWTGGPLHVEQHKPGVTVNAYQVPDWTSWASIREKAQTVFQSTQDDLEQLLMAAQISLLPTAVTAASHSTTTDASISATTTTYRLLCHTPTTAPLLLVVDVQNPVFSHPLRSRAFVQLSCYPRVALFPPIMSVGVGASKLLLAVVPTSSTTNDVKQPDLHPLASQLVYEVADPHVASVNEHHVITGISLGNTTVSVSLPRDYTIDSRTDGLSDRIIVEVKFESFLIVASSTAMIAHHSILAHIEGQAGKMAPGDPAFERVHCEWSIDATEALWLLPPLSVLPSSFTTEGVSASSSSSSPSRPVAGFSVRVYGRRPGHHSLFAHIRVFTNQSSSSSSSASSLSSSSEQQVSLFEQSIILHVLEPLTLLSPASLLLPFHSQAVINVSLSHDSNHSLEYHGLSIEGKPCKNNSLTPDKESVITVQPSGTLHTRYRANLSDPGDDAVVLIRSTAVLSPAASSASSSASNTIIQTVSVQVSIRPVAQLSVRSTASLNHPLCGGNNYTLAIVMQDQLGRSFDNIDEWTGERNITTTTEQNQQDSSPSLLRWQVSQPDLLLINVLSPTQQHIQQHKVWSKGVVAHVVITAVNHTDPTSSSTRATTTTAAVDSHTSTATRLSSLVLKFWLYQHPQVPAIYLHLYVSPLPTCDHLPEAAQLAFRLPSLQYVDYPLYSTQRRMLQQQIKQDLVRALDVGKDRIQVVSIDPILSIVTVLILPVLPRDHTHLHTWLLSQSSSSSSSTSSSSVSNAASPLLLAHLIQTQLQDRNSKWRAVAGSTGANVDREYGVKVKSVTLDWSGLTQLLDERDDNTQAVWSDEVEWQQWGKQEQPTTTGSSSEDADETEGSDVAASPSLPRRSSYSSPSDPYELLAIRLQASWAAQAATTSLSSRLLNILSRLISILRYPFYLAILLLSSLWLYHRVVVRRSSPVLPPSFWYWCTSYLTRLFTHIPNVQTPTTSAAVGTPLNIRAAALGS